MRPTPAPKDKGKVRKGVGPMGSVLPTARWKPWDAAAALFAGIRAGLGAAGLGAWNFGRRVTL